MANLNAPRGLVPIGHLTGAPWNQQGNLYYIPSTDSSAYYIGDAVKTAASSDAKGIQSIAKAAAGDTLRGVVVGFVTDPSNPDMLYVPAIKTKGYYAYVVDDPMVVFGIQDNGGATLDDTAVGKNASIVVAVPTAPANQSATALDATTVNTTQALVLKIVGVMDNQDTVFGNYTYWKAMINQHELMGNTAGI